MVPSTEPVFAWTNLCPRIPSSSMATAIQVTSLSLKVSAGQPIVKTVLHAVSTNNREATGSSPSPNTPQSLSAQKMLEQKVQSVINEQQQILNSKKAQMGSMKTEAISSLTHPVMSNTIRRQPISLPQQPVPQHLLSTNTRNPVELIQTEMGNIKSGSNITSRQKTISSSKNPQTHISSC